MYHCTPTESGSHNDIRHFINPTADHTLQQGLGFCVHRPTLCSLCTESHLLSHFTSSLSVLSPHLFPVWGTVMTANKASAPFLIPGSFSFSTGVQSKFRWVESKNVPPHILPFQSPDAVNTSCILANVNGAQKNITRTQTAPCNRRISNQFYVSLKHGMFFAV